MLLACETSQACRPLDSIRIVCKPKRIGNIKKRGVRLRCAPISSNLKGSTQHFGWLQASATKAFCLSNHFRKAQKLSEFVNLLLGRSRIRLLTASSMPMHSQAISGLRSPCWTSLTRTQVLWRISPCPNFWPTNPSTYVCFALTSQRLAAAAGFATCPTAP
jgi:hypothetical protein